LVSRWQRGAATTTESLYTHRHAVTATGWMLLLIAQPMAIRTRRPELHRTLGGASYGVVPAVPVSMVLLARQVVRFARAGWWKP